MLVQSVPSLAAIAAQASLDAMVICAMVGCSNRTCWAKSTNRNFFRLPKIVEHQGQRTKELCERRRRLWLARINRSDLNEGAGVRVCGAHFVMGRPAKLWQEWDPDWAPSLLLGYSAEHGDRLERVHAAAVSPTAEPITEEDDSDRWGDVMQMFTARY